MMSIKASFFICSRIRWDSIRLSESRANSRRRYRFASLLDSAGQSEEAVPTSCSVSQISRAAMLPLHVARLLTEPERHGSRNVHVQRAPARGRTCHAGDRDTSRGIIIEGRSSRSCIDAGPTLVPTSPGGAALPSCGPGPPVLLRHAGHAAVHSARDWAAQRRCSWPLRTAPPPRAPQRCAAARGGSPG